MSKNVITLTALDLILNQKPATMTMIIIITIIFQKEVLLLEYIQRPHSITKLVSFFTFYMRGLFTLTKPKI